MQRLLILSTFLVFNLCLYGQSSNSIHLKNSYFITGQPIFGLGFERAVHPSLSLMLSAEYGKYASVEEELLSASIESYNLSGFGLQGELRWYCFQAKHEQQRGLFLAGTLKQRWMTEYQAEGISAFQNQLELNNLKVQERWASGRSIGLLTGYRVTCGSSKLSFEIIAGTAYEWQDWRNISNTASTTSDSKTSRFIPRAELGIVYTL